MQPVDGRMLPSSMGFEQEEWFGNMDGHGPHYTGIANGKRVCVWDASIDNVPGVWRLCLARPQYKNHVGVGWLSKCFSDDFISVSYHDEILLMALIHKITSEGNLNVRRQDLPSDE